MERGIIKVKLPMRTFKKDEEFSLGQADQDLIFLTMIVAWNFVVLTSIQGHLQKYYV